MAKIPVKKKKIKKQAAVMQRVEAPAADTRASEPCLGSTLRSIGRDTSAYTASPVAAVAESLSSPQSEIDDVSAQPSSAGNDDGPGNHAHLSNEADAPSPRSPHQAALHDVTRVRASTANIIEQAALSGIEEFADAEERIDAIVSRAQVSSSPGKRGGRAVEDEGAPKVAAASSQKAHMLPYLQRCARDLAQGCFSSALTHTYAAVVASQSSLLGEAAANSAKLTGSCSMIKVTAWF